MHASHRRLLLAIVAVTGVALALAPGIPQAQPKYPVKPIRLIIATTAGSQPDGIARILDLPDVKERLQAIGYVSAPSSPGDYNKLLRAQIEALARLVRDAGLRPK